MVKKAVAIIITLLSLSVFCSAGLTVFAAENTTYTYTLSVDDNWIRTQDAYRSGSVYFRNEGLSNPKDIFYKKGCLYVADSGNGRVIKRDFSHETQTVIGEGILVNPTGIFVCDDLSLYVADPDIPAIVHFSAEGAELGRITRPDSYLFNEQTVYQPKNVIVTSQGNIFAVGQGSYQGLMQFDRNGVFQGFFAANKRDLTFLETVQELILSDEQKDQQLSRFPRSVENIDLADKDTVLSVTQADSQKSDSSKMQNYLKLHNMNGVNIMSAGSSMSEEWNFTDVAYGIYDNIYALTATGLIYEYDKAGNLLFSFGGRAVSSDRMGLFTSAAAITVDENGIIYVLDSERGRVQTFFPTEFATVTHRAIYELSEGNYESSGEIWASVLRLNGNSDIAHLGYGKALLYQGEYSEAMEHFKICKNKKYYSQAFWEIRNEWMNKYMSYILVGIAAAAIITSLLGLLRKRGILAKTESRCSRPVILKMMTHPIDTFYYLRSGKYGSVYSATGVYLLTFFVFVCDMYLPSYLFRRTDISAIPIFSIPLIFFVPLALLLFGNKMISSICEGEGSFKNIYITTAYAFAPYILLTPFGIAASYILSLNEQFIITLIGFTAIVWTGVLLFTEIMQTHNYTFSETVKNVILILFFMIMAVITLTILYLIWTQVFGYLYDLFGELEYNLFRK